MSRGSQDIRHALVAVSDKLGTLFSLLANSAEPEGIVSGVLYEPNRVTLFLCGPRTCEC